MIGSREESEPQPHHPDQKAAVPNAAWNFGVLVADVTSFFIGLSFLDSATALPAIIQSLGGGPVVLGVFAALKQAGFLLPQLFVAHQLQARPRYLPFLLWVCFFGRVGLFGAAAALFWLGTSAPGAALAILGIAYALLWFGDGAGFVPWTTIVGRAIPARQRGRFFARTQVFGGLGRIGVGLVVARALSGNWLPFPASGALLVLICGVFMAISFFFLVLLREPLPETPLEGTPEKRPSLLAYLGELPARLRARPDFGRLALAQALAGAVSAAFPFYLGYARDTVPDLPPSIAGPFLITLTVGGLACAPLWGWLTDRHGPRSALMAVMSLALLSPLLAGAGGLSHTALPFFAGYFCLGAVIEGGWAIFTNYLLETIPGPEQPTYIGLMSLLNAPSLLLPLAAGLLVRAWGVPAVLAPVALLLLAGLWVAYGLTDPRKEDSR